MKVLVAIPTLSTISAQLAGFLLSDIGQAFAKGHRVSISFETRDDICRARNNIVKTFLNSDNDLLFMLDADVIPPAGTTNALIEANKPIVAGVYFRFDNQNKSPIVPVLNGFKDIDGRYGTATRAGAGCMMIQREVFQRLRDTAHNPPFSHIYEPDGSGFILSEDWHFCEMAREIGYDIVVDTHIICSHAKSLSPEVLMNYLPKPSEIFKEQSIRNEARNDKIYWDRIWMREGSETWRQYPTAFNRICEIIGTGKDVLDVGCGVGILAKKIKDAGNHAFGFDISETAINEMDAKFGICGVAGKVPTIPWQDKAFDWTVATEFLEHFSAEEAEEVVKEMARVGQNSIFTTPNNTLTPKECEEHCNTFTPETLRTLLGKHYESVEIETFTDEFSAQGQNIALPTILAICKGKANP